MTMSALSQRACRITLACCALLLSTGSAQGQSPPLDSAALLAALQRGGQVIVMRHASSPRAAPDKATANPDNKKLERQLDATGRDTAAAMGRALRALHIPIGPVLSSPTYRALETIRLAQLPTPGLRDELGDGGHSMKGITAAQGVWLQAQVNVLPVGTNTLIVTHFPNINLAFPQYAAALADGESLVFGADGNGGSSLLARIRIEDWPTLGK